MEDHLRIFMLGRSLDWRVIYKGCVFMLQILNHLLILSKSNSLTHFGGTWEEQECLQRLNNLERGDGKMLSFEIRISTF